MINRTIHFPSLIIGVSKALRGVFLNQVVANILQVQVKHQKNLNNLTISLPTLQHFIHFDLIELQVASHLILALTHQFLRIGKGCEVFEVFVRLICRPYPREELKKADLYS